MENKLVLSSLGHTWILDLDGTILKHNGYKESGEDTLLPGASQFINGLPESDFIVFITSRNVMYKEKTEKFLHTNGIRFDSIIYNAPYGERILINDNKPSGLKMAYAINKKRDTNEFCEYNIDREV